MKPGIVRCPLLHRIFWLSWPRLSGFRYRYTKPELIKVSARSHRSFSKRLTNERFGQICTYLEAHQNSAEEGFKFQKRRKHLAIFLPSVIQFHWLFMLLRYRLPFSPSFGVASSSAWRSAFKLRLSPSIPSMSTIVARQVIRFATDVKVEES